MGDRRSAGRGVGARVRGDVRGGGMVHGRTDQISSTKAEHCGVLSVLVALAEEPGLSKIRHLIDNHTHYLDSRWVVSRMRYMIL